jgi:hypothetical protein
MLPTRFVTFVAVTLCFSARPPAISPATPASPKPSPIPRRSLEPDRTRAEALYSLRARRRFAAYMRMRLLELRSAGLAHAADVIEHRLSPDGLVPIDAGGLDRHE